MDPKLVRRLVAAAVVVAVAAVASSMSPVAPSAEGGLPPFLMPLAVALALVVSGGLLLRGAEQPAVRVSALALFVVAAATAAGPFVGGLVITLVARFGAAVVPLGLTIAGAREARDELNRSPSQGILIALLVLLGFAATVQLGRRAVAALEDPAVAASE